MLYRARVCMIGNEKDMQSLCHVMLENYGNLDEENELLPPTTLKEMQERIRKVAMQDGADSDTFLYEMISDIRYGDADTGTQRLEIVQQPCGLWTACFAYDSTHAFQVHEWMNLHNRCGQILMLVQHAGYDFGLDKGQLVITAGQVLENWDTMGECWLWLIQQYECGYPPEEAVDRLKKLEKTLRREDFDMSIDELLESCAQNL